MCTARHRSAARSTGLDPLQGHGIRIGATFEYLLRGVPFDVMKVKGCWASEAFVLYLRKHAQIMAPYMLAVPDVHESFIYATCRQLDDHEFLSASYNSGVPHSHDTSPFRTPSIWDSLLICVLPCFVGERFWARKLEHGFCPPITYRHIYLRSEYKDRSLAEQILRNAEDDLLGLGLLRDPT